MAKPVAVVPPDPLWRAQFVREARVVAQALGGLAHTLHHIGSTAIEGIHAKPVIDMLLLVPDLGALDARAAALQQAGYEAKGEYGIAQRRYFRKSTPQGVRTHHLHAFVAGNTGARRHLAFRDYMNAHPDAAQAYSELKRRLAERHPGDAAAYIAGKDAFVQRHEAAALAWQAQAQAASPVRLAVHGNPVSVLPDGPH